MIEISKIFIPVDFSDASRKALDHGVTIAQAFGAGIVLACVVEDPSVLDYHYYSSGAVRPQKAALGDVRADLAGLVPEAVRQSTRCSFVVSQGLVEDELLASIHEARPDLVVMGTHGRRAFRRWFLGSVTEHMLRHVPVPVLTVSHPEAEATPWTIAGGHILYATDLSEGSALGLKTAYELARRFEAELTVLHVMLPLHMEYGIRYIPMDIAADHRQIREDLTVRLEKSVPAEVRSDPRVHLKLEEGVPYEVIPDLADGLQADLIVINLHGEHRKERPLLGTTAERVVRTVHGPVLSIPMVNP